MYPLKTFLALFGQRSSVNPLTLWQALTALAIGLLNKKNRSAAMQRLGNDPSTQSDSDVESRNTTLSSLPCEFESGLLATSKSTLAIPPKPSRYPATYSAFSEAVAHRSNNDEQVQFEPDLQPKSSTTNGIKIRKQSKAPPPRQSLWR